jgi:transketolase
MLSHALEAATLLEEEGISTRVLDMHTVKPVDEEAVKEAAQKTQGIVSVEEHLLHEGLGSRVGRVVLENRPAPMRFTAISDEYARSGELDELLEAYGLSAASIITAVRALVALK